VESPRPERSNLTRQTDITEPPVSTDTAFSTTPLAAPTRVTGGPSAAGSDLAAPGLRRRLTKAILTHTDGAALLTEVAQLLVSHAPCTWIIYRSNGPAGSPSTQMRVLAGPSEGPPPLLRDVLAGCGERALADQAAYVQAVGEDSAWAVMGVPIQYAEGGGALLAVSDDVANAETTAASVELAAAYLVLWQTRYQLADREIEAQDTAAVAELLGRLATSRDLSMACYELVNELQRSLGCQQVVLGLRHRRHTCRVAAMSGAGQIDRRSDRVRALEAVCDESAVRGALTVWPPGDDADRHAMLAHKHLAGTAAAGCVVSAPIVDEQGTLQGAWIFLGDDDFHQRAYALRLIEAGGPLVGSSLALLKRAERGRLHQWVRSAGRALRTGTGWALLLACLLAVAGMFLPLPYKVNCDCELQPVVRRYVAAPFDATLERSLVEPGDLVAADQLLAKIDGREIRWELAGVTAERTRAAKQRDGHMATHEFGEAELARYEMERLDHKARLLEHRGNHLEIRSPIDGIVISGDLKKAEGVPLTVGQTLFEIAPLHEMIVEIAVPEDDVRHVEVGHTVQVVLDAFPREKFTGNLIRIHPRSEIQETEHVFIGEFELDNPHHLLRPGMHGTATITTEPHPLGWNLFHKPWEKLLYWLGV
jgi:multidrug efflux pump subunit AcrA (membrane-fusion protein)